MNLELGCCRLFGDIIEAQIQDTDKTCNYGLSASWPDVVVFLWPSSGPDE
jgi:hypothetical protein